MGISFRAGLIGALTTDRDPGRFAGASLVGLALGLQGPRLPGEKELCGPYSLGGKRVLVHLGKANRSV